MALELTVHSNNATSLGKYESRVIKKLVGPRAFLLSFTSAFDGGASAEKHSLCDHNSWTDHMRKNIKVCCEEFVLCSFNCECRFFAHLLTEVTLYPEL